MIDFFLGRVAECESGVIPQRFPVGLPTKHPSRHRQKASLDTFVTHLGEPSKQEILLTNGRREEEQEDKCYFKEPPAIWSLLRLSSIFPHRGEPRRNSK